MKILGTKTGTSEAIPTKIIKEMEEEIFGIEYMVGDMILILSQRKC